MEVLSSGSVYSGFQLIIRFLLHGIYLGDVSIAPMEEKAGFGDISPLKSPFAGAKMAARGSPGVLLRWPEYSASSNTIIKTVLGDLLLPLYLGNCIQMQIDLNPINPFNHVCESACMCVCPRTFVNTHHTCICTYLNSP